MMSNRIRYSVNYVKNHKILFTNNKKMVNEQIVKNNNKQYANYIIKKNFSTNNRKPNFNYELKLCIFILVFCITRKRDY